MKPGSFQTGPFCFSQCLHPFSVGCLGSLLSFPPNPPFSSYSSPQKSSQSDVCKTEIGAYPQPSKLLTIPTVQPSTMPAHPSTTVPPTYPPYFQVPITPTHPAPLRYCPLVPPAQSSFLPQDLCTYSAFCQKCFYLLCTAYFSALGLTGTFPKSLFLVIQCKGPP